MENAPSTALPNAWIDRIFERLLAMYGRKFADMWACVEMAALKDTWAAALGDLKPEEISKGLGACLTRDWPPTLPEFRGLCRQVQSYETAFTEAAMKWPNREGWTSPANYWAAACFGRDIKILPYSAIKARWIDALDRARQNPQPIPDPVKPEFRVEDHSVLSAEEERALSLETAARVMAYWQAINPDAARLAGKNLALRPTRQPGDDLEDAA